MPAHAARLLRLAAIPAIAGAAFLLFLVQPLLGRFILPWFGGAPATWNACLLFFQVALLVGYAYAYASLRWLSPRAQTWTHLALLAAAVATLPLLPVAPADAAVQARPTASVLLLLAQAVGLPYVVLAATAPLVQGWLVRGGGAPWRWYALSNLAALVALIGYPVAVEPWLGRSAQCAWWTGGFAVVALGIALCAWAARIPAVGDDRDRAPPVPPSSRCQHLAWLVLPAIATVLLAATTNRLCLDVAPVPFLWVLPLALYLLSFVLAFAGGRWYPRAIVLPATALALLAGVAMAGDVDHLLPRSAGFAGVLFLCCWALHCEVVRLRPAPARLAGFYLCLAGGGALGGAVVALLAPRIFTGLHEFPLGLIACAVALAGILASEPGGRLAHWRPRWAWATIALALTGLVAGAVFVNRGRALLSRRNFHGVLQVRDYLSDRDGAYRKLQHGTTLHGVQWLAASRRGEPTAYYGPDSGIGRCLRLTARPQGRHIGVIGLGIGTLACWAGPRDRVRFYEINPAVVELAWTAFSVLADHRQQVEMVIGDGRLALTREPAQAFSVLVVDAFSGDAVPAHLLTREALALYRRHLEPGGVIAVHITNRHLDLRPLVYNLAEDAGLHAVLIRDRAGPAAPAQCLASDWMLLTDDLAVVEHDLLQDAASRDYGDTQGVGLWTDERSDLFRLLR